MAIVKMNKFTLLTFESKKQKLLREIQGLSNVEFINLQDDEFLEKYEELKSLAKDDIDLEYSKYEENLSKAKFALEFLKKYVPKKSGLKSLQEEKLTLTLDELDEKVKASKWEESYNKAKEKEAELANLDSNITKLQAEIDTLIPWQDLDVAFSEIKDLKNTSYFLGTIAKSYEDTLLEELSNAYVEIISRSSNDINLLILSNKEDSENVSEVLRGVGFSAFKTEHKDVPMKLILEFKHQIEELQSKKFFIEEEIASFEEDLKKLELAYDYFVSKVERVKVSTNFLKTKNICAIQGWIAQEDNEELKSICSNTLKNDYYIEFEDVKEDEIDDVPIKLKNGELVSAFESVTGMYSYPKYNQIDPTPLLAPFYLIFFGMMVADVGYGLLVLIGAALALKFLKLDEGKKDFAKFFLYLSFPTIFFGAIYGSFFGDIITLPTQIIDTNKDVMTIVILSLALGVIQIFFGLFIKVYSLIRIGKAKDALLDPGSWIITLLSIGGIAAVKFLKLPNILGNIFIGTAIIGAILIVIGGGREEKSTGAKIGQGLYSLYGITGYVGDLVSYTRLMALGLAGGSIAGALNLLIHTLPGVAAIVIGPILFVLFHIFNLGLSLLGAYVHTARLQYVEYFGKFYEGGGRPFKAFKVSEKYIKIKRN
ncbi:MAG: V-type ATP synthase subunit I [Clostridium sp.]|jgi:V/A-type H+/Na+-transporting ATPase subunit I|uniref:V-type ATP synthase subunit I n=1 Tax=Clostridium TaxID=1485 RepID=UPI00115786B8|nr:MULTISPECIES: V-type ATP synthase subunit I [Clostridium]MBS5307979.1 V-type ATP synthase subunit I [Clostridium sp.]MDB1933530.1 V-type ATP synthase subunit I [Clostridium tertium]MDB1936262.1 V-type ATP synthase subunit I [Clostridium tertium]MDB1970401.1 V-type ATP synthase subunit I [Clostridium tertium]MDU2155407.1 V-type ATP synthase subunit I [Clostridium sp.]